jgi:hypothetical protein
LLRARFRNSSSKGALRRVADYPSEQAIEGPEEVGALVSDEKCMGEACGKPNDVSRRPLSSTADDADFRESGRIVGIGNVRPLITPRRD